MRDQFQRSEQPLAGNVLAQEPASSRLQRGNDVLGLLRGARMTAFTPGLAVTILRTSALVAAEERFDARQPDAAPRDREIALQLLVQRGRNSHRPKSGFAKELTQAHYGTGWMGASQRWGDSYAVLLLNILLTLPRRQSRFPLRANAGETHSRYLEDYLHSNLSLVRTMTAVNDYRTGASRITCNYGPVTPRLVNTHRALP